ncbi:hypothetical protein [Roseivirga sp. E12]|uniref:hypothetical protein n=1 Tax=Roseivirga sp. E12 TaxID=2819237 RepID=UPI001ABCF2DE|nr:hypothetical protein [Roseivirga sp. E12]MBO3699312.1 hypothetical protein [Roseivirga sp. E12]
MDRKISKWRGLISVFWKLRKRLPEFLLQSILLTLGVVIALAIGNWDEERKRKENLQVVLENLELEAINNTIVIRLWQDYYDSLVNGIDKVFLGEVSIDSVVNEEGVLLERLVSQKQPVELLQETTWETAQTSNLVNYFDYKTLYKLTDLYNYQERVVEQQQAAVANLLVSEEAFDTRLSKNTLHRLKKLIENLSFSHQQILKMYSGIYSGIE